MGRGKVHCDAFADAVGGVHASLVAGEQEVAAGQFDRMPGIIDAGLAAGDRPLVLTHETPGEGCDGDDEQGERCDEGEGGEGDIKRGDPALQRDGELEINLGDAGEGFAEDGDVEGEQKSYGHSN